MNLTSLAYPNVERAITVIGIIQTICSFLMLFGRFMKLAAPVNALRWIHKRGVFSFFFFSSFSFFSFFLLLLFFFSFFFSFFFLIFFTFFFSFLVEGKRRKISIVFMV